ncbi:MAG: threonylcarbamoyl-AMP synthase [Spirochaetales bacterium]|nr:threonylcarbamoyl-AMP synthase [Spirochaetales bacterium]
MALIVLHPTHPEKRLVQRILSGLHEGLIYIVPTDTVYAFIALFDQPRAINEIYRIKKMSDKQPLSLLCRDVAMASVYARNIPNQVFRFMKAHTPGPYTFIFAANRLVDRRSTGSRKTMGIRIVDHVLHRILMEELELPLMSSSITVPEEFHTDPQRLETLYGHHASMGGVVDGGIRTHEFSTVIDCSEGDIRLVRQGRGDASSIAES